jgi:integrase
MRATVLQKRGKWGVRLYSGDQQKWRTVGSGEEARAEANQIAAEINRQAEAEQLRTEGFLGLVPPKLPVPAGDACRRWLAAYAPKLSKGTYQTWLANIERHIVPSLGQADLRGLTEAQLIGFADACYRDKGLAPGTVANCLSILRRVVRVALRDRVLKQPPPAFQQRGKSIVGIANEVFRSHGISARKNPPRRRSPWTSEEAERLLELAETHEPSIFEVCATAYYTGARKGEILGLRRDRINLVDRIIVFNTQITRGQEKFLKSKDHPDGRAVPVAPRLAEILERLFARRRYQHLWQDELPWAFLSPEGKRWQESNLYHRPWKRLMQRAQGEGIRPFDFHSFRHTFIVLSLQAGRSPKAVADIVGDRLDSRRRLIRGGQGSLLMHFLTEEMADADRRDPRCAARAVLHLEKKAALHETMDGRAMDTEHLRGLVQTERRPLSPVSAVGPLRLSLVGRQHGRQHEQGSCRHLARAGIVPPQALTAARGRQALPRAGIPCAHRPPWTLLTRFANADAASSPVAFTICVFVFQRLEEADRACTHSPRACLRRHTDRADRSTPTDR